MWPFRRKPKVERIPEFRPEPQVEPKPEPIEVIEVRDPTDSMVMRIKDLINVRLKRRE